MVLADTQPFCAISMDAILALDERLVESAERVRLVHVPHIWSSQRNDAPVAANGSGARVLVIAPQASDRVRSTLPASAREVERLREDWPDARVLSGEQATCAALRELNRGGKLGSFDVIVFATHAVFFAEQPRLSALSMYDGEISVHELASYTLNASLVVVSACDAARAAVLGGEERMGIEQTLLRCGARNVVAPIWEVDDAAAARFSTALLRRIRAGDRVEDAFDITSRDARSRMSGVEWAAWRHSAAL
jgi:CHAT domain-containing protein